jgi:hypothetical protein
MIDKPPVLSLHPEIPRPFEGYKADRFFVLYNDPRSTVHGRSVQSKGGGSFSLFLLCRVCVERAVGWGSRGMAVGGSSSRASRG